MNNLKTNLVMISSLFAKWRAPTTQATHNGEEALKKSQRPALFAYSQKSLLLVQWNETGL
jgi:hypothetical protein